MSSVAKDPGVASILLFSGSAINFLRPLYVYKDFARISLQSVQKEMQIKTEECTYCTWMHPVDEATPLLIGLRGNGMRGGGGDWVWLCEN